MNNASHRHIPFCLLVTALTMGTFGCTTTDVASTCQELDWYQIGREDGLKGLSGQGRRPVKSVCADSDQSLSEAIYNNGFDNGIAQFCSFENGYQIGYHKLKSASSDLCPPVAKADFLAGVDQGEQVLKLETEERSLAHKIEALSDRLSTNGLDTVRRGLLHGERLELQGRHNEVVRQMTSLKKAPSI